MPNMSAGDPWRAKMIAALLWSPKTVDTLAEECGISTHCIHGMLSALRHEGILASQAQARAQGQGDLFWIVDPSTPNRAPLHFGSGHEKAGPQAGFSASGDRPD